MSVCKGCGTELPPKTKPGRARVWCTDRCRKQTLYSRPCVDCGKPLNGSDGTGPDAPERCVSCAAKVSGAARKVWTREACVMAMQEWAAEHNGVYPTTLMWSPSHAVQLGSSPHPDYVDHPDRWPCWATVVRQFGSWRACVVAAGFTPRERGQTLAHLGVAA